MQDQTIGTCSLCGGAVTLPVAWYSVTPPVATCSQCGAVAAAHGPVIPMVRPVSIPTPFSTERIIDDPWRWQYTAVPNTGGAIDLATVTCSTASMPLGWKPGVGGES